MSEWDTGPAVAAGEWQAEGDAQEKPDWFSKHDNGSPFAGGQDNTCRNCKNTGHFTYQCPDASAVVCFNCGEPGHNKANCPNEKVGTGGGGLTGECFNCGEVGHNKADCPNPKVERPFTGTCRHCNEEGHRAAECPTAPAVECNNCGETGHATKNCQKPKVLDYSGVPDMTVEEAMNNLKAKHDDEKGNLEQFEEAAKILCKAAPNMTWQGFAKLLLKRGMKKYMVIAYEREPAWESSFVNLQGKIDCKYVIKWNVGFYPTRGTAWPHWPKNMEENLDRLGDAGAEMELGMPKCKRCNEWGHVLKFCKEEKLETDEERACRNCGNPGHQQKYCPEPIKTPEDHNTCRRCGQSGHKAADCTEEENLDNVECRKCSQTGHYAKDCPNTGGGGAGACRNCGEEGHFAKDCEKPRVMKCRNCDEEGHVSRECPKPTDWSRVKCTNCGEFGHSYRRCNNPAKEPEDGGFGDSAGAGFGADVNVNGASSWEQPGFAATEDQTVGSNGHLNVEQSNGDW